MKKFLQTWPFLSLAGVTIAIGAAWHLSGLKPEDGPFAYGFYAVSYAPGLPFITATQVLRPMVGSPALAGILSLAVGLVPYLFADWLLRRRAVSIPAAVGIGLAILALAVAWVRSQCFPLASGETKWQCGVSVWLVALAYLATAFTAAFLARQRKVAAAIAATALVLPLHAFVPFFGIVFFGARWHATGSLLLFVALPAAAGIVAGVWANKR